MNIVDFIPSGKENAVTKKELMRRTGLDERTVRAAIKREVEQGTPILSSSGHRGYWYSEDLNEIEEFLRESEHRYNTGRKTLAALKKRLYEAKGIKVTPVRQHYRRLNHSEIMDGQIEMAVMQ